MTQENKQFNKYTIEAEIGRGGFGTVYRAIDNTLDRPVALKILEPLLSRDSNWVMRFRREAKLMAKLDHPHIVPVYETGEESGRLYIAMKLIDGPNLAQTLKENGRLSWDETIRIMTEVASALDFAHQLDIIHRDLKPGNILLGSNGAILTDFGLAQLVGDHSMSISLSGGIVGTPAYLAPEVWEGDKTGSGTDIYALGCILYEMVTGRVLFSGESTPAIMRSHFQPLTIPQEWPEDVPQNIAQVLETTLARNPSDRYATAQDLINALLLQSEDKLAEPYQALETAVATEQWEEAIHIATNIRAQNPDYRDVATLEETALYQREQTIRQTQADQWRAEAEKALADGEWVEARLAGKKWRELSLDEADANNFLNNLSQIESVEGNPQPVTELDDIQSPTHEIEPQTAVAEFATENSKQRNPVDDHLVNQREEYSSSKRPGCITAYAILLWLLSGVYLLVGIGFVALFVSTTNGEPFALLALACFGILVFLLIATGIGLMRMKKWGWILAIVSQLFIVLGGFLNLVSGSRTSITETLIITLITAGISGGVLFWFFKNRHMFS